MDWVEVNGVSLRYELAGSGANTIVLVHEMGGSLETWDDMVPALIKRWRVLRYDTREAGFSEKTGHVPGIATMTDDIAGLLDGLDITAPVAIAGCALGGAIAMHFAASHPQRTAALMAMSPATIVASDLRAATLARADKAEREGMRSIADDIFDLAYPPVLRGDADRYRIARARLLGVHPASFAVIYRMLAGTRSDGGSRQDTLPDPGRGRRLRSTPDACASANDREPNTGTHSSKSSSPVTTFRCRRPK